MKTDSASLTPITRRQFAKSAGSMLAVAAAQRCLSAQGEAAGIIRFETDDLRLDLGSDGQLRSLLAKGDQEEYADGGPIATVFRGGRMEPAHPGIYSDFVIGHWVYREGSHFHATSVRRTGDQLTIDFGGANVTATCLVTSAKSRVVFELQAVTGSAVDRIEFLQLGLRRLPNRGEWINFAYNDRFGVCLCGANAQTDIQMVKSDRTVQLRAAAEAGVGFAGTKAILFGCPEPQRRFLDAMAAVERDFELPAGATFRRSPNQRLSYLWASEPDPQNIGEYIERAKQGGFRMLLLSYRCFSKGAGHYEFNERYPNGFSDLKRVTAAIRAAGLKTGLHIHYNKIDRTDPYVTPVPDARLHASRNFTLAETVSADADGIAVMEDPAGTTLDGSRCILRIGDELVEYHSYQEQSPFAFTGCQRGYLGTKAAAHAAGTRCSVIDVDTWPLFIRIDQNTDLQDEVAARIAEIYHRTGPYDMVYFDGAEDVHEPFWYHGAAAQQRVFRRLTPPPTVTEAPFYTHFSWHMISRANAYDADIAQPANMKDFCRLLPSRTAGSRALDFSRIDFGWLGGFGVRHGDLRGTAGPDIYEYVASSAAAWDCPISLVASREDFRSNPRADDCLAVLKIWEDARLGNHLSESERLALRNVEPGDAAYITCYEQRGVTLNITSKANLSPSEQRILSNRREHHLFVNESGAYELVEIEEVVGAGNGLIKAFVFSRQGKPGGTVVLLWAVAGEVQWEVKWEQVTAMRPFGTELSVTKSGGGVSMIVGRRTYVFLQDLPLAKAKQRVGSSKASNRQTLSP